MLWDFLHGRPGEKLGESALEAQVNIPLLISSNYDSLCYFVSVTELILFFHLILPPRKTMGHSLKNLHVLNLKMLIELLFFMF